jgi:hypothetical protein
VSSDGMQVDEKEKILLGRGDTFVLIFIFKTEKKKRRSLKRL